MKADVEKFGESSIVHMDVLSNRRLIVKNVSIFMLYQPSRNDRGWFIYPYNGDNPWWTTLASAFPALVAVILIFMDQQITAVIVNRKEYKLKVFIPLPPE